MIDHEEWRKSLNVRAAIEEEMYTFARKLRKGEHSMLYASDIPLVSAVMVADKLRDWATRLGVPEDWKTFGLQACRREDRAMVQTDAGQEMVLKAVAALSKRDRLRRVIDRAIPLVILIVGASASLLMLYLSRR